MQLKRGGKDRGTPEVCKGMATREARLVADAGYMQELA